MIGKVNEKFRFFFSAKTKTGAPRTGLVTANFSINIRNPQNTATLAAPTVTEVGVTAQYFFDIPASFTALHGPGQYGGQVAVILNPTDLFNEPIDFFLKSLNDDFSGSQGVVKVKVIPQSLVKIKVRSDKLKVKVKECA